MSDDLIETMRKKREELWQAYLSSPNMHSESLRQGKFEGYDMALRQVLAAQPSADHGDGSGAGGGAEGEGGK